MTSQQPIQFLLHQLATNEGDRERFNMFKQNIETKYDQDSKELLFYVWISGCFSDYSDTHTASTILENPFDLITEKIIRTCLSRVNVNGEAVLGVFEGWWNDIDIEQGTFIISNQNIRTTDHLCLTFDHPLRNGKPLEEAIQAFGEKMLELVPEYREFLKNNK